MTDLQRMEQEKSVLRWGGLAGILGGLVFVVVFVVVGAFQGMEPAGPEGFPDIRASRTVENGLYLLVLVLWVPHFLALYRVLRETSLAPALFGSVLGIVGLGVLAAGALTHAVEVRLSNLYHAPGATPEDQATLALLWQAKEGLFDALLIAGLVIVLPGCIALGVAMLGSAAFGRGFGGVSVALGVVGFVASIGLLIDPLAVVPALTSILMLIIFHFVLGWKVYGLSRAPYGVLKIGERAGASRAMEEATKTKMQGDE